MYIPVSVGVYNVHLDKFEGKQNCYSNTTAVHIKRQGTAVWFKKSKHSLKFEVFTYRLFEFAFHLEEFHNVNIVSKCFHSIDRVWGDRPRDHHNRQENWSK